jgi:hypothetical protein
MSDTFKHDRRCNSEDCAFLEEAVWEAVKELLFESDGKSFDELRKMNPAHALKIAVESNFKHWGDA